MKPGLELKLGHNLTITPQLQQAIRLLQLSTFELNLEINSMLEENPLLETIEEAPVEVHTEDEYHYYLKNNVSNKSNSTDKVVNYENFISNQKTLFDYVEWQLNLTPLNERDVIIGLTIIDALNDDGYLELTIADIYQSLRPQLEDLELAEVKAVQKLIQNFDPVGIACEAVEESLLVQLECIKDTEYYYPIARDIIKNDLKLLAKKNFKKLAQLYNISLDEINIVMQIINKLNPNPGRSIGDLECNYIIPDVHVYKNAEGWHVRLNEHHQTKVRLSASYSDHTSLNAKDTSYIKQKLSDAKWFLKSISNRNDTLLSVAKSIVEEQIEFLEHGPEAMKPLILQDIASRLDLHESTISRITNQKYIATPQGIFELKYFFSSHLSTINGMDCSSIAIKAIIKGVVGAEDTASPMSDQAIAELLNAKGINIARRTVAKYREALHIPSSVERKK